MKKISIFLLLFGLLLVYVSCSDDEAPKNDNTPQPTVESYILINSSSSQKYEYDDTITFSGRYMIDTGYCPSYILQYQIDASESQPVEHYGAGEWYVSVDAQDLPCGSHTFTITLQGCDITKSATTNFMILPRLDVILIIPTAGYTFNSNDEIGTFTGTYYADTSCCEDYNISYRIDFNDWRELETIPTNGIWTLTIHPSSMQCGSHTLYYKLIGCDTESSSYNASFKIAPAMSLSILEPLPTSRLNTGLTTLTIRGTYYVDSDCCSSYKYVEYAIDNQQFNIVSEYTADIWQEDVDVSSLSCGMHSLKARINACESTSDLITSTFTLYPAFSITITSPTDYQPFVFNSTIQLLGTYVVDETCCTSYTVKYVVDAGTPIEASYTNNTWQANISATNLDIGVHTVGVILQGCELTASASTHFQITNLVDVKIQDPPNGVTFDRVDDIKISGTYAIAPSSDTCTLNGLAYNIDNGDWISITNYTNGTWSADVDESILVSGPHTINVLLNACSQSATDSISLNISFKIGNEFKVNDYVNGDQYDPKVDINSSGDFIVVWSTYRGSTNYDIAYKRYHFDATLIDGTEGIANSYLSNQQTIPDAVIRDDGSFAITWQGNNSPYSGWHIYLRRFDSSANPLDSSEVKVDPDSCTGHYFPVIAKNTAGFWLAWNNCSDIYYAEYDWNGNVIKSPSIANTYLPDGQDHPSISINSFNKFVIAWHTYGQDTSRYGIAFKRFYSNGNPLGDEVIANVYYQADQTYPTAVIANDGKIAVFWQSYAQDGWDYGIFGRSFTPEGSAIDLQDLQINSQSDCIQQLPSADIDASNNIVVVWKDSCHDGSGWSVYARSLKLTDTGLNFISTEDIRINSNIVSDQVNPFVTLNSQGKGVVVWPSRYQDTSGWGIYAQRISLYK